MSTSVIPRVFPSVARHASTSTATGKHKVVVIGGGAGGLAVANQVWNALKAQGRTLAKGDIAIIDVSYPGSILLLARPPDFLPHAPHSSNSSRVRSSPVIRLIPSLTPQANPNHDYQPGWTVVGSGLANKHTFRRPLDSLIPGHIAHVHARASGFEPERNQVILEGGGKVGYDYLVVAPGLQTNYDKVKNLSSALSDPLKSKVSTIYSFEVVDKTWELIQSFKGDGEAIFTQPFGPVKCAGAPQKIAYMADSFWKQSPPAQKPHSTFSSGMPTMFSVPHYSRVLDAIREEKGITGIFNQNLIEVRPDDKTAVFEVMTGEKKGERVEKEYGMLHVTPPMGPVDFVKSSALADGAGWVDVDAGTLQHKKYENVFSLGDASSLPTSKTAAAITAQSPVLSHNLLTHMSTGTLGPSAAIYDGYTSCPLFTGRGELLLAEFKYGLERKETFGRFVDQSKPNRAFYHLTKDVFPRMYFSKMLKGEWYGPKGLFPPQFVPS